MELASAGSFFDMYENEVLERIKNILLLHKGKDNAVTAKAISRSVGFPMEDTQLVCRRVIWETAKTYGLPVVSCGNGYFIAETEDEIREYNMNIQGRINGMERTREIVNTNFRNWKNNKNIKEGTDHSENLSD